MKAKTIIIIAVIVIAVSIGGYFIYNKLSKNPASLKEDTFVSAKYPGQYTLIGGKMQSLSNDPVLQRIIEDMYKPESAQWVTNMQNDAKLKGITLEDQMWSNALWLRQNDNYWKSQS